MDESSVNLPAPIECSWTMNKTRFVRFLVLPYQRGGEGVLTTILISVGILSTCFL